MSIRREGKTMHVSLEGSIGETNPMFGQQLAGITEINMDMSGVTYINSIGVKQWVMWTVRIPRDCKVGLFNTPFVIVVQASTVLGFYTPQMRIESIRSPYACDECGAEMIRLLIRGTDYDYGSSSKPHMLNIPAGLDCPKCNKKTFNPDFLIEKSFKFLTLK